MTAFLSVLSANHYNMHENSIAFSAKILKIRKN